MVRVFEAAKEMGVSSKELMERLAGMGIPVANHMASLDEEAVAKLRAPKPAAAGEIVSAPPQAVSPEASVQAEAGVQPPSPKAPPGVEVRTERPHRYRPGGRHKRRKGGRRDGKSKSQGETVQVYQELPPGSKVEIPEGATVKEFAEKVGRHPTDVIRMLMRLGEMVTINEPISGEAISVLAEELGLEVHLVTIEEELEEEILETGAQIEPRPPVVTVMGHVDHGKTSLLDAIRKTDVVTGEAGGITQHIGAYQVIHDNKKITFIDTPGHEAFTAMRARGAKVTDVAVLVVAADDGVMPQTVEAIDHARAAKVPIVVAVNKIDKSGANPDRVRQGLADYELIPEGWGGDTVFVEVSAKKKTNLNELLDMIQLVADMQELKAPLDVPARGVAIEAKLDKGRGPVATVLVQRGVLRLGDPILAGVAFGRVRAMLDDKSNVVEEAHAAQPVEVLGFSTVPHAGDEFRVVADEKTARQTAEERALKRRLVEAERRRHVTLDSLADFIREGEIQELNLIIKADTQGSIEALRESLEKLDQREVRIKILHRGTGAISETDVMLASASNAIVIGFNVRPDPKARTMAEKEKVDVRLYRVIYKIVEDINAARIGMLSPVIEEVDIGRAEVRATFKASKIGVIAGCMVTEGEITRDALGRLVREGTIVWDGKIASLRHYKDDVASAKAGTECGMQLENFHDIKEGDVIEAYRKVEKAREA